MKQFLSHVNDAHLTGYHQISPCLSKIANQPHLSKGLSGSRFRLTVYVEP